MQKLPKHVTCYGRSPEFSEKSIPESIRSSHSTKTGTWARIVVVEGRLLYQVLEDAVSEAELSPEAPGIVAPEVAHRVEPIGEVRFFIEFYR